MSCPTAAGPADGGAVRVNPREIQELLAAADAPPAPDIPGIREAAVFVLLRDSDSTQLLLIRRAARGDAWSSHIAFPGGHIESTDADPLQAAYRETHEELGIHHHAICYLGDLGHFPVSTMAVDVHAFVGLWSSDGTLTPNPAEVAQAIETPLDTLRQQHYQQGFANRTVAELGERLAYPLAGERIWGVTARIIHTLLSLMSPSSDQPSSPDNQ